MWFGDRGKHARTGHPELEFLPSAIPVCWRADRPESDEFVLAPVIFVGRIVAEIEWQSGSFWLLDLKDWFIHSGKSSIKLPYSKV